MVSIKRIVNTVICYDNAGEVLDYAKKISAIEKSTEVCLIIVINKLDNYQIQELKDELDLIQLEILLCQPSENLGYMNGMLYGYEYYKKKTGNHQPDYVIMSNTDIDYPDYQFISKLINKKYEDDVWVVGPAVFVPERETYDNPVAEERRSIKEIDSLIRRFNFPLFNQLYVRASLVKGHFIKKTIGNSHKVYEVHGCFFIIKGIMADKLLKEPFGALLYSEETYIAEMAHKFKKIEFYDIDLIVNHMEHSVTGKVKTKKIAKYLAESMKVIKQDFYKESYTN